MRFSRILSVFCFSSALAMSMSMAACSSRDVAVTGETQAATGAALSGPIKVQFYELNDGELGDVLHDITQSQPGKFNETVSTSADKLRVIAINDTNGDSKCSAGEAWAQADIEIKDDNTVEPVALELKVSACP